MLMKLKSLFITVFTFVGFYMLFHQLLKNLGHERDQQMIDQGNEKDQSSLQHHVPQNLQIGPHDNPNEPQEQSIGPQNLINKVQNIENEQQGGEQNKQFHNQTGQHEQQFGLENQNQETEQQSQQNGPSDQLNGQQGQLNQQKGQQNGLENHVQEQQNGQQDKLNLEKEKPIILQEQSISSEQQTLASRNNKTIFTVYKLLAPQLPQTTIDQFPPNLYSKCEKLPKVKKNYGYEQLKYKLEEQLTKRHVKLGRLAPGQEDLFYRLGQEQWIQTVCGVGLNVGYNVIPWLATGQNTRKIFFFDQINKNINKEINKLLHELYPYRFTLIVGDSRKTLWNAIHLYSKCDVVIVDGEHRYLVVLQDLINMKRLSNPKHHLLILNEYPSRMHMNHVAVAWVDALTHHGVYSLFSCIAEDQVRGFTVGVYNI